MYEKKLEPFNHPNHIFILEKIFAVGEWEWWETGGEVQDEGVSDAFDGGN